MGVLSPMPIKLAEEKGFPLKLDDHPPSSVIFCILIRFSHYVNLPTFQHFLKEKNYLAFIILHFCFIWQGESEEWIYNKSIK